MAWHKLGLVYVPDGSLSWAASYASFPTVDILPDSRLRIYFTALDKDSCGRTGYVEVDAGDPCKVISMGTAPVLDTGEMGDFDDCGANSFSIVTVDDKKYLYYQGWQRTSKAPYLIFTGLAIAGIDDSETFSKIGRVPVLDRTEDEPYMRAAPFVLRESNGFRMWYVTCTHWKIVNGAPQYYVKIRTANSSDGIHWDGNSQICIEPAGEEYAVGRPCVLACDEGYRMWYSIRSNDRPYRIGYAESKDGASWRRLDDSDKVIIASSDGWDSEMVCYPYVIQTSGRQLMFYNGNQHGRSGFGVAEWRGRCCLS